MVCPKAAVLFQVPNRKLGPVAQLEFVFSLVFILWSDSKPR